VNWNKRYNLNKIAFPLEIIPAQPEKKKKTTFIKNQEGELVSHTPIIPGTPEMLRDKGTCDNCGVKIGPFSVSGGRGEQISEGYYLNPKTNKWTSLQNIQKGIVDVSRTQAINAIPTSILSPTTPVLCSEHAAQAATLMNNFNSSTDLDNKELTIPEHWF